MNLKSSMNSKKTEEKEEMKKADCKKERKKDKSSEMPTPIVETVTVICFEDKSENVGEN